MYFYYNFLVIDLYFKSNLKVNKYYHMFDLVSLPIFINLITILTKIPITTETVSLTEKKIDMSLGVLMSFCKLIQRCVLVYCS